MSSPTQAEQTSATITGFLPPPSGVTPNFEDPPNGNTKAMVVLVLNLVAMLILSTIRALSRFVVVRKVRVEDYLGLVSVGGQIAFLGCMFRFFSHVGWMVAGWNVPADKLAYFIQLVNYGSITYNIAVGPLKVAILLEWSHIFVPGPTRNTFWWICHILMFINGTYYIIGFFLGMFTCVPREFIWNKELEGGGTCLNSRAADLSSSALNLCLDIAILLLPQRVIWTLNIPFRRKLGIATIFACGLITCACAATRLKVTVDWLGAEDTTFWAGPILLWAATETTCMMLVFCLPALPKLLGSSTSPNIFGRIAEYWLSRREPASDPATLHANDATGAQKMTLRPSIESSHPLQTIDIGRVSSHGSSNTHVHSVQGQPGTNITSTTHFSIREDHLRNGSARDK